MTVASLVATWLYANNVTALRHTVRSLEVERSSVAGLFAGNSSASQSPLPALASATAAERPGLMGFVQPSSLAGTLWHVQIRPMSADVSVAAQTDQLQFESGTVISTLLSAQGFPGTNYSLTLQSDGTVLWETMQTGPRGEVVCWRGEWDGRAMRGILTRQVPDQPAANFSFIGIVAPQRDAVGAQTSET